MWLLRFWVSFGQNCFETWAQVIGQEAFPFDTTSGRPARLDTLLALVNFVPADQALSSLYKLPKGEKAWPPLAMFKALLLATWYDLSDVMLAEALSDRASFRRFCGFARDRKSGQLCNHFLGMVLLRPRKKSTTKWRWRDFHDGHSRNRP